MIRKLAAVVPLFMMTGALAKADHPGLSACSPWLVSHLKEVEGLQLTSYQDAGGRFAIGYGHQVSTPGLKITKKQAFLFLVKDILFFHNVVKKSVTREMTQNEHDALVSFAFNVGPTGFKKSTVLKHFNAGLTATAAFELLRYTYADGKPHNGLFDRRLKELRRMI